MIKPSIDTIIAICAKKLAVPESAIRDVAFDPAAAIRLFVWTLLSKIGHTPDGIATDFQTTPETIKRGLAKWQRLTARRKAEPLIMQHILDYIQNTPNT